MPSKDALRSPIFIGNAPSSGSTLLLGILGRSPRIYQRDEVTIFDKRDWIRSSKAQFQNSWSEWKKRGYRRRLACEMRNIFTFMDEPVRDPRKDEDYISYMTGIMDDFAFAGNKNRWVEKTPANIFSFDVINSKIRDARFVVIRRDARSVVMSLSKRGYSPVISVARWYLSNLVAWHLAQSMDIKFVSYERLVVSPREQVKDIFDYLGEIFEDSYISSVGSEIATNTVSSWTVTPRNEISTKALYSGQVIDASARECFARMRPSKAFLHDYGIKDFPSPIELQQELGYSCDGLLASGVSMPVSQFAGDIVRYCASMARYRYFPRALPFYFS